MPSPDPLVFDHDFQGASPAATDRVPAATLDAQITAVKERFNELLSALGVVVRDDDTLADGVVRARCLHPEVAALIASKAGWQPKVAAAWATTANITLSGLGTQAGGEWTASVTAGTRILVKDQTTASQNGIYLAAAGAWSRATDADTATELGYAFVPVTGGALLGGSSWVLAAAAADITLGTTALGWAQVGGSGDALITATGSTTPRRASARAADVVNVRDFAATGDGSTNDQPAITTAQAASLGRDVVIPVGTYLLSSALTTGARLVAIGLATLRGLVIPTAGFWARGLRFFAPSARAIEWTAASQAGIRVQDCTIDATVDMAFHARGSGQERTEVLFSKVRTPNYGVLLNNGGSPTRSNAYEGAAGGRFFSVVGCDVEVVNADAVELNQPGAAFKHTITALNYLGVTSTTPNATAGLAYGQAAIEFAVVLGNHFTDSLNEAIHIEDIHPGTVIIGNVGKTRGDGIRVFNDNWQLSTPISILGNSFKNGGGSKANKGLQLFWIGNGAPKGPCVVGNVFDFFIDGMHFGAPAGGSGAIVSMMDNNSVVNCTYAITSWGAINANSTRQYGDNYASDCDYLFKSYANSAMFGRVHSRTRPTGIIHNAGYGTALPSRCDGFSYPLRIDVPIAVNLDISNPAGLFGGILAIPFGGPCQGRVRVWVAGGPTSGNGHWGHLSADIHWNGTTLTVSNILKRVNGNMTEMTFTNASGGLYLNLFASVATTIERGWVEFDGEYWDA